MELARRPALHIRRADFARCGLAIVVVCARRAGVELRLLADWSTAPARGGYSGHDDRHDDLRMKRAHLTNVVHPHRTLIKDRVVGNDSAAFTAGHEFGVLEAEGADVAHRVGRVEAAALVREPVQAAAQ